MAGKKKSEGQPAEALEGVRAKRAPRDPDRGLDPLDILAEELSAGFYACQPISQLERVRFGVQRMGDAGLARCLRALESEAPLDPNARVEQGSVSASLLCCAAAMGSAELCEALMRRGADVEDPVSFGPCERESITALGLAVRFRFDEAGEALAKGGADPSKELWMASGEPSVGWVAVYSGLGRTVAACAGRMDLNQTAEFEGLNGRERFGFAAMAVKCAPAMFETLVGRGLRVPDNFAQELRARGYDDEQMDWALERFASAEQKAMEGVAMSAPSAVKTTRARI